MFLFMNIISWYFDSMVNFYLTFKLTDDTVKIPPFHSNIVRLEQNTEDKKLKIIIIVKLIGCT